jgi:hypothetical protein
MADVRSVRPPTLGILTMPDDQRFFRGNRQNFIDIIEAGKQHGVQVYVLTTSDFHPDRQRVLAYEFVEATGDWRPQWIPMPHVIYNRIPFREDEERPEVRRLLRLCRNHPNVTLYNPSFFNKRELFQWLKQSRTTRRFAPRTRNYSRDLKLLPMLKRYAYLYLKPQSGQAGQGIMRLRRKPSAKQPYVLSIQEDKGSQTLRFARFPDMRRTLDQLIGDQPYIVQQGIRLCTVNGRPFDLRVLVQKNRRGRWSVTGIGARMAGEASITTHVPRGGTIEDPRRLLNSAFGPRTSRQLYRRTSRAAIRIARQIERGCGAMLGEMSMDLGVDVRGRLWFFEANSKPMKFDEPEIRAKSLANIVQYCAYLANKRMKHSRGGYHYYAR